MNHPNKDELHEQIDHNHSYHRPDYQETMNAMGAIRDKTAQTSHLLVELCPLGRELSLALKASEEVMLWAISALARNEPAGSMPNTTSHPTGATDQPPPPLLPGDPGYIQEPTRIGKTFDSDQSS